MNLDDLSARVERLDQLSLGLAKEEVLTPPMEYPLLLLERKAYLTAIQDALSGVEAARVTLVNARQQLDDPHHTGFRLFCHGAGRFSGFAVRIHRELSAESGGHADGNRPARLPRSGTVVRPVPAGWPVLSSLGVSAMIQCSCPKCGYRYEIAGELAGKSVLCPECHNRFKPAFRFRCPSCKTPNELPEKTPGLKMACRSCGQHIQIPGIPPQAPVPAPISRPAGPPTVLDDWSGAPPPARNLVGSAEPGAFPKTSALLDSLKEVESSHKPGKKPQPEPAEEYDVTDQVNAPDTEGEPDYIVRRKARPPAFTPASPTKDSIWVVPNARVGKSPPKRDEDDDRPRRRTRTREEDYDEDRRGRGPGTPGPSVPGILSIIFGGLLVLAGLGLVIFFWAIYDTTVLVVSGLDSSLPSVDRVHNIGRMNNRTIGVIGGFGCLGAGMALTIFGVVLARSRIARQ
jgi:hypothetical protein